jgi:hypothetical protein
MTTTVASFEMIDIVAERRNHRGEHEALVFWKATWEPVALIGSLDLWTAFLERKIEDEAKEKNADKVVDQSGGAGDDKIDDDSSGGAENEIDHAESGDAGGTEDEADQNAVGQVTRKGVAKDVHIAVRA